MKFQKKDRDPINLIRVTFFLTNIGKKEENFVFTCLENKNESVCRMMLFLSYFVLTVEHFSIKLNNGGRTVKKPY